MKLYMENACSVIPETSILTKKEIFSLSDLVVADTLNKHCCGYTSRDKVKVCYSDMSRVTRKHVFGVSNQVLHKLGCTATEDC